MSHPGWIDDLFAAIDAEDAERFVSHLTDDAEFRLGNLPPVQGRESIHAAVSGFWSSIQSSSHEIEEVWQTPQGVMCRGKVRYVRHDGSDVTIPFANVFHMAGERISRYLVYGDFSEL
jgi:ketosteroid isomerase-like protein